nr:MAG TPA: hypothetical protein [Caudoviricetes sp.]
MQLRRTLTHHQKRPHFVNDFAELGRKLTNLQRS